jgi:LPXTG-site transpeptidase (sortase) family protein
VLEIPKLDVNIPIVGVPLTSEGWDVTWLGDKAGYLETTAFPTVAGNTAITAHVFDVNNNPGPFAALDDLQYGDQVIVHAWGQAHVYEVRSTSLVRESSMGVLSHEDYDWVTLLTCEDYSETLDTYRFRRAVRAVLVEVVAE